MTTPREEPSPYGRDHLVTRLFDIVRLAGGDQIPVTDDFSVFIKMLDDSYTYSAAVNAKGEPFPAEALLMALVFHQHQMINLLMKNIGK